MNNIYNEMVSRRRRIEEEIHSLQRKISAMPEGKLICTRNGKRVKCYRSNGHEQIYIPTQKRALIEQLAAKKYLSLRLRELQQERTAVDFYLRHHSEEKSRAEQLLSQDSPYAKFLIPYFTPLSQELAEWMNSPYEHNPMNPEQLIHKTHSGYCVRSKSEAMIAMTLFRNRIPFRYECSLQLGEYTIYPDFTIRHPSTGQTYYWEHFGLMDQPQYYKNAFSKMQLYTSHQIIPSIQLITTYETKDKPLDLDTIERMVEQYFL